VTRPEVPERRPGNVLRTACILAGTTLAIALGAWVVISAFG